MLLSDFHQGYMVSLLLRPASVIGDNWNWIQWEFI